MRISPLCFLLDISDTKEKLLFKDICNITHKNDEAYIGALALPFVIRNALNNQLDFSIFRDLISFIPDSRIRDKIHEYSNLPNHTMTLESISQKFGNSGYVVESVPFDIYSALKIIDNNLIDVIFKIIKTGGDADTNASMAGNIMGAFIGFNKLPKSYVNALKYIDDLKNVIDGYISIFSARNI